ncbi:unnamed protein product [Lymnaea stagnalis]|uniref:CD109 antigen-like n=1 Tax=Lymnaea stagnalis TaxID=6523 RepID=A0AAV2HWH3_LYMST
MRTNFSLGIFACICCSLTCGLFLALAPKEAHPGWPLNIAVTVYQSVPAPVSMTATLKVKEKALGVVQETLQPGETKLVSIQVPHVIPAHDEVVLSIEANGGVTYQSSESIRLSRNSSVVLVETDKAIYRPGQKVRIRVIIVDKDLKPVFLPVTLTVVNSKNNKLEEFNNITSRNGVIERIFELSDYPSLGVWKINVAHEDTRLYTHLFTVEEFVLPRFSVEVIAKPNFIVTTDKNSRPTITVSAKYTYGKGVQGKCALTIVNIPNTAEVWYKELTESGTAEFTNINWQVLEGGFTGAVTLRAEVTDETGRKEAGETTLHLHQHPIKIKILDKSTKVLRTGLPADIYVQVSDHSGNPVSPVNVILSLTFVSLKPFEWAGTIPEGETIVSHTFIPTADHDSMYRYYHRGGYMKASLASQPDVTDIMDLQLYMASAQTAVSIKSLNGKNLMVGVEALFSVNKTLPENSNSTLAYVVVSNGNIIQAGPVRDSIIRLTPTLEFCPSGKLMVYMIIDNKDRSQLGTEGEVVVDALDLMVSRCFSKEVEVSFLSDETRIGTEVDLNVAISRTDGSNAMAGVHDVFYLAVDKSIVLLQGSTDLNKDKVTQGFSIFESVASPSDDTSPYTASGYFNKYGIVPITTTKVVEKSTRLQLRFGQVAPGMGILQKNFKYDEIMRNDVPISKLPVPAVDKLEKPTSKPRKDFPDTWLWGQGRTNMNGKLSTKVTLPDTITSWMVSAFAINDNGLAVGEKPFELKAFQLFFLTMNLPYSIKRGEIFILKITVFNYRNQDVDAVVAFSHSDQYSVLESEENNGWYEKSVSMPANRAASVSFKINATVIGKMELHVTATDAKDGQKDEVKRELLVKPEGEERSRALTKVLMLKSEKSLNETFYIHWPSDKIVADSKRVEVKVTGDVFGQALSGLEQLVTVPCGCGEQNMITTVPNIFGLKYIRETRQEGMEALQLSLITNMKRGYQRQVEGYRHKDGSYSAWGETSGSPGSTWLTAFVVRSFSQASQFISIDTEVLKSGIEYLRLKQGRNGQFQEAGKVLHSDIQAGTGSGDGLTVYVLISMLEASKALGESSQLNMKQEVAAATQYISQHMNAETLKQTGNKFLAALVAYSLSLVSDNQNIGQIDQLLSFVADSKAPWLEQTGQQKLKMAGDVNQADQNIDSGYGVNPHASKDLEIGAYVLLTYTHLGRLAEGFELMKWLQSQQNSKGGFYSTQDTVMVLQALSEFGSKFNKLKGQEATLSITEPAQFLFNVSGSRSLLLQTAVLPSETEKVQVTMTGEHDSIVVVKVVYTYHTLAGDDDTVPQESELSIVTKSTKVSENMHKVEACVKSLGTLTYNGMFVTSIILPSGEKPYEDSATILSHNPRASRVDTDEKAIHFYMDSAPGDGYCLHAHLERQLDFEVQKPGSARVYAYYSPENAKEVALVLEGKSTMCSSDHCETDGAIMINVASLFLTTTICTLVALLMCI